MKKALLIVLFFLLGIHIAFAQSETCDEETEKTKAIFAQCIKMDRATKAFTKCKEDHKKQNSKAKQICRISNAAIQDEDVEEETIVENTISKEDKENEIQIIFSQTVWNGTANTDWYSESMMEFTINTAEELAGLAVLVNSKKQEFEGKTIKLGTNIMLNNTANWKNWENNPPANVWTPIGTGSLFRGIFDGNGYIISGIYINSTDPTQGLFAQFTATMKNLGVIDSYINGVRNIGGLAGFIVSGKIINSYFIGTVTGQQNIGGLVGTISNGTIINSHFMGTVTGQQEFGGLVGHSWGSTSTVNNSYYDMETSNLNTSFSVGEGKTTTEVKRIISSVQVQVHANKESINEINALIKKNNIEANVILDKCSEHQKLFAENLQLCLHFQDSIKHQPKIDEIKSLLKANKMKESLEECNEGLYGECLKECKERWGAGAVERCVDQCNVHRNEKIIDLCEKQLVAKIKKLPKNKINSIELAKIYYGDDYDEIVGYVIQNDGKMILVSTIPFDQTVMIQISGHVGSCNLGKNTHVPFRYNAKSLGQRTYTTVIGARQSVPNYQLLWCE
ncbi:MAG: hypothetical protein LBU89_02270 [Fibromonadaceae bacterium]|jgi:hypothetical protein|nr:hypothetical protein [Fibromonadaceae bacterium]